MVPRLSVVSTQGPNGPSFFFSIYTTSFRKVSVSVVIVVACCCVYCVQHPFVVASRWELTFFLGQLTSDATTHFLPTWVWQFSMRRRALSGLPTPPPLPPMTCQIILARCTCPPYPINPLLSIVIPPTRRGTKWSLLKAQGTKQSLPSRRKKKHKQKKGTIWS